MKKSEFLIFNGYRVENISYICNNEFKINENSNIIPEFGFALVKSPKNEKNYNVIIGFSYSKKQNQPFIMEGVVRGFFELGDEINDKILFNAFGILFPYVRSLITDMTRYSISPIIIPTINIMNEIQDLKSLYLESDYYISSELTKKNNITNPQN